MKIAILEPDLEELDRALETLSSIGHVCFGATCDGGFRRLLDEVSVDLFLLDWTNPDSARYETLHHLAHYESAMRVGLYVSPHTPYSVIDSGLRRGASFSIEKPLRRNESLDSLHALTTNGFYPALVDGNGMM